MIDTGSVNTEAYDEEEILMMNMFYYTFYGKHPAKEGFDSIVKVLESLVKNRIMMREVIEILQFNYKHLDFIDKKVDIGAPCPLDLHCSYTRDQILAGLGNYNELQSPALQEGVGL